jgi:hypothetical protein
MALIGNYTVLNKTPGRFFAGGSTSGTNQGQARSNSNGTASRSVHYGDGNSTANKLWGQPTGGYNEVSWMFPYTPGYISSYDFSRGVATTTATIIDGRPIAGTATGLATAAATLQLVVSGQGTSNGVATATGNILAALLGAGSSSGSATATGTMQAKAWATGAANGVATTALVRYATGQLQGSIAPAVELDASIFSTYLLDEQDVETGLTLRQALRLVTAASAGKISGASGTTVTIRNALADSKDRVVATVDSNGNRTAITYDLD